VGGKGFVKDDVVWVGHNQGTLLAQRFDLSQATISGEPAVVARRVGTFSTARSGGVIDTAPRG
jgi:hypothetical protein